VPWGEKSVVFHYCGEKRRILVVQEDGYCHTDMGKGKEGEVRRENNGTRSCKIDSRNHRRKGIKGTGSMYRGGLRHKKSVGRERKRWICPPTREEKCSSSEERNKNRNRPAEKSWASLLGEKVGLAGETKRTDMS